MRLGNYRRPLSQKVLRELISAGSHSPYSVYLEERDGRAISLTRVWFTADGQTRFSHSISLRARTLEELGFRVSFVLGALKLLALLVQGS